MGEAMHFKFGMETDTLPDMVNKDFQKH